MVEPQQAEKLPELSDEAEETTLDEIGKLTLGSADTDALRTLFMWKNVAAANRQQSDDSAAPPEPFDDHSVAELREISLSAASNKKAKLRLLEYYISEEVL